MWGFADFEHAIKNRPTPAFSSLCHPQETFPDLCYHLRPWLAQVNIWFGWYNRWYSLTVDVNDINQWYNRYSDRWYNWWCNWWYNWWCNRWATHSFSQTAATPAYDRSGFYQLHLLFCISPICSTEFAKMCDGCYKQCMDPVNSQSQSALNLVQSAWNTVTDWLSVRLVTLRARVRSSASIEMVIL